MSAILIILSFLFHSGNHSVPNLEGYLKKNLSAYESFEYEIVQIPKDYKKLNIEESSRLNISGNLAYIPIKFTDANNRSARSYITVRLKLYKTVLAAVKRINQRERLTRSDFRLEKMDVSTLTGTPVDSSIVVGKYRSKIYLNSGDVLTEEMIEPEPIINPGDPLKAKFISGSVIVSLDVISRQEGLAGQIITVISKDNKLFKAKVIDSQNVIIVE